MSTAEVYEASLPVPNLSPQLAVIEGGQQAEQEENLDEPHVIQQTLLPMVEIQPVNEISNLFDRIANLDTGSDTAEAELALCGVYLWQIGSRGQGIHFKRKFGVQEDTRIYIHWDDNQEFGRLRMHRWSHKDGRPSVFQAFHSNSVNNRQPPSKLVEAVRYLEEQVKQAESIAEGIDRQPGLKGH